jgi:hypothetical protein
MSSADIAEIFTFEEGRAAGLSRRCIYALRDAGELVALGGGLYRRADAPLADLDLIEIAERTSRGTLCLESALVRHGLIDSIPLATEIAIARGDHRPGLRAAHRFHTFDPDTFNLGRDVLDVGARRPLGIYSPERCLIDVVRLRHRNGTDVAWEALRRWLELPGRNPGALLRMAGQFRGAEPALRQALEILL